MAIPSGDARGARPAATTHTRAACRPASLRWRYRHAYAIAQRAWRTVSFTVLSTKRTLPCCGGQAWMETEGLNNTPRAGRACRLPPTTTRPPHCYLLLPPHLCLPPCLSLPTTLLPTTGTALAGGLPSFASLTWRRRYDNVASFWAILAPFIAPAIYLNASEELNSAIDVTVWRATTTRSVWCVLATTTGKTTLAARRGSHFALANTHRAIAFWAPLAPAQCTIASLRTCWSHMPLRAIRRPRCTGMCRRALAQTRRSFVTCHELVGSMARRLAFLFSDAS